MGSTIRAASLVDYPEIAQSVGLDPYEMLERVELRRSYILHPPPMAGQRLILNALGIGGGSLRNPDLRISADPVAGLLQASASTARVGFRAAVGTTPRIVEPGTARLNCSRAANRARGVEVLIQYLAYIPRRAVSPS